MDAGFVTSEKRATIIHVGSHSSLGSTCSSAEIVCNQLNFNGKIFALLADFFSLRNNSANPNISRILFPAIRIFFRLQIGGLVTDKRTDEQTNRKTLPSRIAHFLLCGRSLINCLI